MIAPNDTKFRLGLGPGGLHGYDHNYTLPRTGWRPPSVWGQPVGQLGKYGPLTFPLPQPAFLGDAQSIFETIISSAERAYESSQPSAVYGAIYGGQNSPPPPGTVPAAAGSISFGGNTGTILIVLGLAGLAFFSSGRRRR